LAMCPGWGVIQPPAGISYLKGFLKEHGVGVKCLDLNLDFYKSFPNKEYWDLNTPEPFIHPDLFNKDILPDLSGRIDRWAEDILSNNPIAVGLSLFMSSINASLVLAKRLKELNPDLPIIGGGAEVYRMKRIFIDGVSEFSPIKTEAVSEKYFDILVLGEGEATLLELLNTLKAKSGLNNVKGIMYHHNDNLILNNPRDFIEDMDTLCPPDYGDFLLSGYTKKSLPVCTSRGCINRCTFCSDRPLWKTYRFRSPQKVIYDIEQLVLEYKINGFEVIDSNFNGDMQRLAQICDLIIKSGLQIEWSAKVSLREELSFKVLCKMRQAGCSSLAYGLESGSPGVLEDMRKNINLKTAERIIRDTHRAGIHANCFFIIGYPTETEEDFQMTLDFIQKNANYINRFDQITGCHIEEDSYLGLNAEKYGIVFKDDGWHSRESTPVIRKERLERFKEFARKLHQHYNCQVQG